MMIELSIIIVNFNVKELLEQTLLSVKRATHQISKEIFVVDNASTDGSVGMIRQKFPEVKLIANKENIGFGKANNQAMAHAQGRFFVILNPDTVVQEDTFSVIIDFFEKNSRAGMVGCKILNPDGSLQLACRRSFPTPWVGFTRIVGLSRIFPKSKLFGKYNLTYLDPDETYEVEAISGSFMVVRSEVAQEVGFFDESFFMYGEDLDWCYRIQEAGWKIYYVPDTKIIHFKGESTKKAGIDLTIEFYRAMRLFVQKHYHSRYFYLPQWFLVLGITLRAAVTLLAKFITAFVPVAIDLFFLNLSLIIALFIRFGSLKHLHSYIAVTIIYSTIWLICLALMGVYSGRKLASIRAASGIIIGFILNASITFFFNMYAFSRAVVLISGFFNLIFISGWRFLFKLLPRFGVMSPRGTFGKTILRKRALIVGTREGGKKISDKLRERVDGGYEIIGIVTLNEGEEYSQPGEVEILGSVSNLDAIIRQQKIQEVIFATEQISYDTILAIMARCSRRSVNFKLVPSSMEVIIGKASVDRIGALPLVDIDYTLNRPVNIFIKRTTDIVIATGILAITFPVLFYLKFIKKLKLRIRNIDDNKGGFVRVPEFVPRDSDKMRWTHQLPRLWAVIKGYISLVGSEMLEYSEESNDPQRIALKPGLVGLVQLNKNSNLTAEDKQRYDLFYLKNYSPVLDIEIMIKLIFKI
ncbi:glycosyltransferase [candidate division KSB1 bacterium]|nr:glycosyltransferase [candidate division KSB1 bacterium]